VAKLMGMLLLGGVVGTVWFKSSERIDLLQMQVFALTHQLAVGFGKGDNQLEESSVAGHGVVQLDARSMANVEGTITDQLQHAYGFTEQAELLLKVVNEVTRLKKVQKKSAATTAELANSVRQVKQLQDQHAAMQGGVGVPRAKDGSNSAVGLTTPKPSALTEKRPPCVKNPPLHYENTGQMVMECAPRALHALDPRQGLPPKAFVLTLDPESASVRARQRFLGKNGIRVDAFEGVNGADLYGSEYDFVYDTAVGQNVTYRRHPQTGELTLKDQPGFLTAGERGYRGTMRKLFARLLLKNVTGNVLVMDDDALFHCDIFERLKSLLANPRCGNHVASTTDDGGVMLLGSAIWINGTYPERGKYCAGWKLTDADMRQTAAAENVKPMCFNMHTKTFGTFAVIYHSSVFQRVFDWLALAVRPFVLLLTSTIIGLEVCWSECCVLLPASSSC
jgi:hypothetical protein